ncbi:MAG: hypothetical protein QXH30_03495 [Candidatus Bilamarchaeaceae archaeon]
MAEAKDLTSLIKKTIGDGGVLALLYFDLHGNNKETLVQLGAGLVQKVLKEEGIVFAKGEIDEPMENEGLFSTSIEMKVLTKDFSSLAGLCSNFCPFSLEVLEPQEIVLDTAHMQDLLMYISTSSHDYKKYIIEKLSTPETRAEYAKNLKNRAEIGKKLLEKKEGAS